MNFPLSVSNKEANNAWMDPSQGAYNLPKAYRQWLKLYKHLAQHGPVYILPSKGQLQDLPYVANIGSYLPHLAEKTIIVSNFTSLPRKGEEAVGKTFFESFDYKVWHSPHPWEGEADLKWLRKNLYVGGHGCRSTSVAFDWMREKFGMEIIEVEVSDPKLYHLDCMFFSLTETKALVNTAAFKWVDLYRLEKHMEVVEVPPEYKYESWTNCVRLGNTVLYAPFTKPWQPLAELLDKHGFSLEIFDLSEFDKSGADLSCLVMHMNYGNRY